MIDKINTTTVNAAATENKTKNNTSAISPSFEEVCTTEYSLEEIIDMASEKYNVPKQLLTAVIKAESDFTPDATSYCDARGLMQIMPSAAEFLGVEDRYDPMQNVFGGAKYYSYLLDRYDGDLDLAIAGYGAGIGNVKKYGGVPPFCEKYIAKIHRYIEEGVNIPDKTVKVSTLSSAKVLNPDDTGAFKEDLIINGVNLTQSDYNQNKVSHFGEIADTFILKNNTNVITGEEADNTQTKIPATDNTHIDDRTINNLEASPYLQAFHNYNAYMKVLDILENTLLDKAKEEKNNERK